MRHAASGLSSAKSTRMGTSASGRTFPKEPTGRMVCTNEPRLLPRSLPHGPVCQPAPQPCQQPVTDAHIAKWAHELRLEWQLKHASVSKNLTWPNLPFLSWLTSVSNTDRRFGRVRNEEWQNMHWRFRFGSPTLSSDVPTVAPCRLTSIGEPSTLRQLQMRR